ncbi:MAG: MipA/OmpV family protein [Gammaproteobacteria bacterium]|nr:MipA/OmpV family protein [Gammaproteobacteria bacterium]
MPPLATASRSLSTFLRNTARVGAVAVLGVAATATHAGERPLWELGYGVAGLVSPDYRGSNETRGYLLPLPYIIYRGDILKIDRGGIYSRLFESDRVKLDLSADAGVPVDSTKNQARQGMPNLDMIFEIGPSLEICLVTSCRGDHVWQFRLPVRAVFSTDFGSIESRGGVINPHLNYDVSNVGGVGGWNAGFSLGPLYATERFHDYYYEVAPSYAIPGRPAFDAKPGYSGTRLTFAVSRRFRHAWFGAFARYDDLSGTAFENSPLVFVRRSFMAGFGFAWVFAESRERVTVSD